VKLTYDDFVLFPDDGKRHELIDGEHYVTPSPNLKHQAVSRNLLALIWTYLRRHPVGKVYGAPLDVVFSHFDVVEPDLLFVSEARRDVLTAKNVQGAPDLVVEVGSPSTRRRDEKLKHQLYERFNVTEYWVVDPDIDVVRIYRLMDGKYERGRELSLDHGDVLTTPLLPGLDLPLAEIFAD
jgi:Uma2 family endonuclease